MLYRLVFMVLSFAKRYIVPVQLLCILFLVEGCKDKSTLAQTQPEQQTASRSEFNSIDSDHQSFIVQDQLPNFDYQASYGFLLSPTTVPYGMVGPAFYSPTQDLGSMIPSNNNPIDGKPIMVLSQQQEGSDKQSGPPTKRRKMERIITDIMDIPELRPSYFIRGYLKVTPRNYEQLQRVSEEYDSLFKSHDRVFMKCWGKRKLEEKEIVNLDILPDNLLNLLCCFRNTRRFRVNYRGKEANIVHLLRKVLQYYKEMSSLNLGKCELNLASIRTILKTVSSPKKLKKLRLSDSCLTELASDRLLKKFSNIKIKYNVSGNKNEKEDEETTHSMRQLNLGNGNNQLSSMNQHAAERVSFFLNANQDSIGGLSENNGHPFSDPSTSLVQASQISSTGAGSRVRKKLDLDPSFEKKLLTQLPSGYELGAAYGEGDCFFDALAQWANKVKKTDVNSDKYLRMLCHEFYQKNKKMVADWDLQDSGEKEVTEERYAQNEYVYSKIQYTADECERLFNKDICIWGRPWIEGIMLCRELQLEGLCAIEVYPDPDPDNKDNPVVSYHLVNQQGYESSISEERGWALAQDGSIPILVTVQGTLHFVPLLPKECLHTISKKFRREGEDIEGRNFIDEAGEKGKEKEKEKEIEQESLEESVFEEVTNTRPSELCSMLPEGSELSFSQDQDNSHPGTHKLSQPPSSKKPRKEETKIRNLMRQRLGDIVELYKKKRHDTLKQYAQDAAFGAFQLQAEIISPEQIFARANGRQGAGKWLQKAKKLDHSPAKRIFKGYKCYLGLKVDKKAVTNDDSKKDHSKAFSHFKLVADSIDLPDQRQARYMVGYMYYHGYGVTADLGKACKYFVLAASAVRPEKDLIIRYIRKSLTGGSPLKKDELAAERIENGAPVTHRKAKVMLENMLKQEGVNKKDKANAAFTLFQIQSKIDTIDINSETGPGKWLQVAASLGHIEAQYQLAVMYFNGLGVSQDYRKAIEWFEKAAVQGLAKAQHQLALIYLGGLGTNQNYSKAIYWFEKAADQGDKSASQGLVGCIAKMFPNSWLIILPCLQDQNNNTLELPYCQLGDKYGSALFQHPFFKKKLNCICTINLEGNELGDLALEVLSKMLQGTKIHTINLNCNLITDAGINKFVNCLTNMKKIYLRNNSITSEMQISLKETYSNTEWGFDMDNMDVDNDGDNLDDWCDSLLNHED